MAAEYIDGPLDGNGQYPTLIPGYEDAADIQEALRLYHYGSTTIPTDNTLGTANGINTKSIAGHLQTLSNRISTEVTDRTNADTNIQNQINKMSSVITKGTDFTLQIEDISKTILLSTSGSISLTVPVNSSVAIPVGSRYILIEMGSGITTFTPAAGVTINSKNSQLFIDEQYGQVTLLKVAENSWVAYGDIYEGGPAPTPVAPTPVAPTPVAPTPTEPTPTAPTPTAPTPTAPTPTAPTPTAPTPTAPTPTAPTPVVVTCGDCESYTTTSPTCQGEDSYVGIYTGTRRTCSDGSYQICTEPTFTSFGDCIAVDVSACGGSSGAGTSCTPAPTPTAPTPVALTYCPSLGYNVPTSGYPENCPGASPTPTAPTPTAPTPTAPTPTAPTPTEGGPYCRNEVRTVSQSQCVSYEGNFTVCYSDPAYVNQTSVTFESCVGSTPTPTAPTPTAPTPTAPTPTPETTYCPSLGYNVPTSGYPGNCPGATPTPTAPTPTAPTPTAPTPTAPTPTAPTPTAPTPTAPTPSCADFGEQGTYPDCYPIGTPTPTAPTPTAPTPTEPTPVAPTPTAPTPVSPDFSPFFPSFTVPGAQ
jgi:hypothetical protein